MYLNEAGSDSVGCDGYNTYGPDKWSLHRPPAPPTSIPLDDNFDAYTTEAPTEWNIGRTRHRDYEESVSGLRNYVVDMERKLSGEDDYYLPSSKPPSRRQSYVDSSLRSKRGSVDRKGLPNMPLPENTRKVTGQRGRIELVEQKVMEDGPDRTISLWRERVAQSSAGGSSQTEETHSDSKSVLHRRMRSDDSHVRHAIAGGEHTGSGDSSTRYDGAGKEVSLRRRSARASYERSEYMVAYHQPSKHGYPIPLYPRSELGSTTDKLSWASPPTSPTLPRIPDAQASHTIRRTPSRHLGDRSEYMISYSHVPQQSLGSVTSSALRYKGVEASPPTSQVQNKAAALSRSPDTSSITKATSTSVELILSSCDPPLLHVAPILYELGIQRLEHLRAIGRLSEETRDREIKEQALRRGMTVVEWAILLDKLQSL